MMKKFWGFLILFCWVSFAYAITVQTNEAKIIALNWINSQGGSFLTMDNVGTVYSKIENKIPIFYIVTFKPSGWVIVSGTDIAEPVLGYSRNSQFDMTKMPPQVEGWMGGITNEIEKAITNKIMPSSDIRQKWQSFGGKLVEKQSLKSVQSAQSGPLLTSTWSQGKFYNEMAPTDPASSTGNGHVWLGCVATAMVQVMKYWEYPETGMGSHSYTHPKYGSLSANFAGSTYIWSVMPDNVTSLNTEVQKIGYHCAVSVDMDFGPYSSGAYLDVADLAFINYFKYNSTVFEASKNDWDDTEWKAQLRRDIDAGRPVVYSGYNASYSSGHAWVCDGYSGDYFHFNWGWSGSFNGNFLLSSLTPGSSNFSYDQAALFSIEPATPVSIPIPYFEGFESSAPNGIHLMGVNELSTDEVHIGTNSLRLGKESIISRSTDAASLCFLVPSNAELNFWVKRFTPVISANNNQRAFIMPQYGNTPLIEIYNGDYNDADWVSYNIDLSAYTGQIVRLLIIEAKNDQSKQQWMYVDDISISGISNNLPPYTPSNPSPSNQADYITLSPTLHWSGGDPNGDDLIYKVYFGSTSNPPLIGSSFTNSYTLPSLSHTTTFYWKIVADDGHLTSDGPVWSFTTKGIPPTVGNCGVSNLSSSCVSICGNILNNNKSVVGSRGICWGRMPNPTLSDSYVEATAQTDVFTCNILGLLPYTNYYYRTFANSNQGVAYSDFLNFTTMPDSCIVSVGGVRDILRSTASVTGIVNLINDSIVFRRGVVWSTNRGFDPALGHILSEDGSWAVPGNFAIDLANLPGPGDIYFKVFAENSVGTSYSKESMFTTYNHAPFVDLDSIKSYGAQGSDFRGTCTERTPGGKIGDGYIGISDPDGDTIKQVTVKLINAFNIEAEFLTVLSQNKNLVIEGNNTDQLRITSSKSLSYNDWEEVLRSVEYRNNLHTPHEGIIRQVQVQVSDGFDLSNIATAYLTIIPVNDPPVNQVLPSISDTLLVLGSRVNVKQGIWSDVLDSCNGMMSFSYSWQKKDNDGKIVNLDYGDQQTLTVGADMCGENIRVIEKVTDSNCGGTNIAVAQAESKWYEVGQTSQTITFDPIPIHNYNEVFFILSGKASSGLPLNYNLVSQNNVISISNDTAYILNAGKEVISGIQPGNECYLPSSVLYKIGEIGKSQQEINCDSAITVKYDKKWMKIPASATSGLELNVTSSNSSIAFVRTDTLFLTGTGKVKLTVSQPGNHNYFPAKSVEIYLTVLKGDQSITAQFPDELFYGSGSLPYKAISSSQLDVKLTSSDSSIIDISGDSLVVHGVGDVLITASQPGNGLWNPAANITDSLTVKKGFQKIEIEAIDNKVFMDTSFIPIYHSTSGLDVTFSVRDTSIADVVKGAIVIKNVGETFVDFTQSGNEFWEPSYNETPLKVIKANQSITFMDIENQQFGIEPIALSASSSSGLDIAFVTSDPEVAAISGDSLFILNAGKAQITAIQPGNNQYNPAVAVSKDLTVEKSAQTIVSHLSDSILFDHQVLFADVESTSGLKVDIVSSDDGIVKVVSDSLQVIGPGKVILTLTQPGNRNFLSTETTVSLVISEWVDVSNLKNTFFTIYPNPTEGSVNLIVKGDVHFPVEVNIFNSTGKTIANFETSNSINRIDLSHKPMGIYFVVVRSQNGKTAQKLLKTR